MAPGLVAGRRLVRIFAPMISSRRRRQRMGQRFGLIHIGGAIRAQFTVSLRGCIHYPSAANADESREGRHTVYISDEESIVSSPDNLHILDIRISTPAMLSSGLRACRWQHQQGKLSAYIPNPRTEVIEVLHSHLRLTAHLAAKIFERALLAVQHDHALLLRINASSALPMRCWSTPYRPVPLWGRHARLAEFAAVFH